jgi:hypothetical protein
MMAPLPCSAMGDRCNEEERRLDIDGVDLVEGRLAGGGSRQAWVDTRAVDQHVDPPAEHPGRLLR